jgi:hypothetical protein
LHQVNPANYGRSFSCLNSFATGLWLLRPNQIDQP